MPLPRLSQRFVPLLQKTCLLAGGLWLAGFGWFIYDARQPPAPALHAAGIVALTGGTGRVETSLRLLASNPDARLLISGVDLQTSVHALLPAATPPDVAARITLGYQARSTIGNATETAVWVADHHINSLIIVTAGYHMRRAMLELGRTLPGVTLSPYPVMPPAMEHPWRLSTIRLMGMEYMKWLGALAGMKRNPSL
ncbi:YdcF family protein [Acetobacter sp. LMG 32666]|uniref:YdcF family protein n=1 Tax=Acetobacter sp. LMG 32666 TaxID=2959295 RepID=UPI0030C8816B